ncbi:MAG: phosphatase PAP2 family protein [Hymenobacteraceae bacterium]|nr:phosphatase PAP2 family protein [Hymenobacteraceae bacterium]MDX5396123.1 phosphatase PAP2 family protein [Hymenobacteraceae bacterium]MDX5443960.1 phosphatase PAP2 family protein [Hymenobacteraceae bacterium]MDX5512184.1 phosphatase PAP2 family protein [Hymenobacteraceae bacterium]
MKNQLFKVVRIFTALLQQTGAAHWLFRHHPRFYNFLVNRFRTTRFSGLPLTLMVTLLVVQAMVFSELAESVVESEAIVSIDRQFTQFLYSSRHPGLSQFFYGLTQLGTREAIFALGVFSTLILLFQRKFLAVLCFWATMGGIGLTIIYGKQYFLRARPEDVGFYAEVSFSFPSGHATTAMALFGFLTYFIIRYSKTWSSKVFLFIVCLILILLVGFSRIYLGVHYLSDVLAGFLVGGAWLIMGISVLEYLTEHPPFKRIKDQVDES